jgi:predicted branched-subunit amino acid permease
MREQNNFMSGIKDGFPICLGYLSVAFAFGIAAYNSGLDIWQAVLISMLNVTSAGQLAGLPIMAAGGSLIELPRHS